MKKQTLLLLIISVTVLSFNACQEGLVYEESLKIANGEWEREKVAKFEFDIEDSTLGHEIYLNFRHGGDYPYKNIYLFTKMTSPSGKLGKDTAQMLLANNKGRWLGKGIGDIFDYQFLFKQGMLFPEAGKYIFEVEQAMRDPKLGSVSDIGISIKQIKSE